MNSGRRKIYRITEKVKFVSVMVHLYNCAKRNAILSRIARTMCSFFVDGRIPISPEAA